MDSIGRRIAFSFGLLVALVPASAFGQGLSASLSGSVKDEQGGTLAAATVAVASPAQIGGEQRTTTNDKGQWRFPVLAPGVYVLVVEKAPGFASHREQGISIGAGAAIERPVVLKLASVAQSVTVEADSSVEENVDEADPDAVDGTVVGGEAPEVDSNASGSAGSGTEGAETGSTATGTSDGGLPGPR